MFPSGVKLISVLQPTKKKKKNLHCVYLLRETFSICQETRRRLVNRKVIRVTDSEYIRQRCTASVYKPPLIVYVLVCM